MNDIREKILNNRTKNNSCDVDIITCINDCPYSIKNSCTLPVKNYDAVLKLKNDILEYKAKLLKNLIKE